MTEANYHDGVVGSWLIPCLHRYFPRLSKLWADYAYRGRCVDTGAHYGIDVEIVERASEQKGFVVQARRWVVERTFAWLSNYRRLSKDYEYWMQSSDTMIYVASLHLGLRRLARLKS